MKKSLTKKKIIFSIIIPCFNASSTIDRSLVSLMKQSIKNFEAIIINDGSTDSSNELIKSFITKDPRFTVKTLCRNKGVANSRNIGLENFNGDYICFLDADDWWPNNKLEVYLEYFNLGYDLLYSSYTRINASSGKKKLVKVIQNLNYEKLISTNQIPLSSAAFNRKILGMTKFKNYNTSSDWIFWIELFKKRPKVLGINKNLMFYNVSNQTLSSDKIKMSYQAWRIFRQYHGFGILKSFYLLLIFVIQGIKKRL